MIPACPKPHTQIRGWFFATRLPRGLLTKTWLLGLAYAALSCSAQAADSTQPAAPAATSDPAIVVGFVGGHVHHDDLRHAEVQLAKKLGAEYGSRAHVGIFENC